MVKILKKQEFILKNLIEIKLNFLQFLVMNLVKLFSFNIFQNYSDQIEGLFSMNHDLVNEQMMKHINNFLTKEQQYTKTQYEQHLKPKKTIFHQTLSYQIKRPQENYAENINKPKQKSPFLKMIRIKQQPRDKLILRNLKVQVIRKIYQSQNKTNYMQSTNEKTIKPIHQKERKRLSVLQQIKNQAKQIIISPTMNNTQVSKNQQSNILHRDRKLKVDPQNKDRKSQSDFFPTIHIESKKKRQYTICTRLKDRKNFNLKFGEQDIGVIQPWCIEPAKQQICQLQQQQFFNQFYQRCSANFRI